MHCLALVYHSFLRLKASGDTPPPSFSWSLLTSLGSFLEQDPRKLFSRYFACFKFFKFMCMYIYTYLCLLLCVWYACSTFNSQKRTWDPLALAFQVAVSHLMWVLGTKPRSSLNFWAMAAASFACLLLFLNKILARSYGSPGTGSVAQAGLA